MPTPPPKRWPGAAFLLVGAVLAGALQMGGGGGPSVYDGLPLPADRYRYLDPPPGVRNGGPPLAAHVTIQLVGGGNSPIDLATAERPPQAELSLFHGDIEGNRPDVRAVTTAEVRITAIHRPDVPLPAGRQLHGNVYDVTVVADGVSLQMRPGTTATISLRQPKGSAADPRIAVLAEGHWRLLTTAKGPGTGVLTARLPALGPVTIVEGTSGFARPPDHTWRNVLLTVLPIAALAVLLLLIRRRRAAPR